MVDHLILIGASRGIGRYFLENKCFDVSNILAIGSSDEIKKCKAISNKITPLKLQLSDLSSIDKPIKSWLSLNKPKINSSYGIVCFASQLGSPGGIFNKDSEIAKWEELFRVNLLSHLKIIQLITRHLSQNNKLRIVMFAGGGAAYGYPSFFNYSMTKVATVRAVENIGLEFETLSLDASIIALAPGAVPTSMLEKVIKAGGEVRTKTNISEPCDFISDFINDKLNSQILNGRFLHVRDKIPKKISNNKFFLRRID